ncbi:MAG: CCA tRNA nucleotidyltransferase [Rhodospirillaceae bacterium]|nr:CCA tRNA nucleotidyltransferase [Rhodospirillaceae bacterium]
MATDVRPNPPHSLAPQPWMTTPAALRVMAALAANGAELRFVGGCVRDALLGLPVRDIDIATPDPPEKTLALLQTAGVRAIPTGIDHGTVTAIADGTRYEITTLRIDVEPQGRRARVAFTDNWEADAARRDFTINALSTTADGRVYDPFDGIADLRAGRVRFVGDPLIRIREDVLRLVRFFRFYAYYGRPPTDAPSIAACQALAHLVPGLSGERIWGELSKLLLADNAASVLVLMKDTGVLGHIVPGVPDIGRLAALVQIEIGRAAADALRRLAAMLPADRIATSALAVRLRLSNEGRERLLGLAAPDRPPSAATDAKSARRMLYRLGADRFRDLVFLAEASGMARDPGGAARETAAFDRLRAEADRWVPITLPVSGSDVLAAGIAAGPEVGRLLAAVERWWEEGDFTAGRGECLGRLAELAARGAEGPATSPA